MHRHDRDPHAVGSARAGGWPGGRNWHGAGALIAAAGLAAIALAAVPAAAVASATTPSAAQRPLAAPQAPKLPGSVRRVCPVPTRAGQMECLSLIRTDTAHRLGAART